MNEPLRDMTTDTSPYVTEMVWDGGLSSTGLTSGGHVLTIGNGGDRVPEQLLLLGAEGAFMESFLAAAREAQIQVLGYVSSGHLDLADDSKTGIQITLRPCVVVGSTEDMERVDAISQAARHRCVVTRLLGDQLRVRLDVQLESLSSPR